MLISRVIEYVARVLCEVCRRCRVSGVPQQVIIRGQPTDWSSSDRAILQLGPKGNEELDKTSSALRGVLELIECFYADCARIPLVSVRRIKGEDGLRGRRCERTGGLGKEARL